MIKIFLKKKAELLFSGVILFDYQRGHFNVIRLLKAVWDWDSLSLSLYYKQLLFMGNKKCSFI